MSIVPINDQREIISSDTWDPFKNFFEEFSSSLDLWDPLLDFPSFSREFFPFHHQTQINWKETLKAHVFKAYLPGFTSDQVIVFIDDDRILQISTDDGKFMSRFQLPENAIADQVKASMNHGLLTVTVAKEMGNRPNNVRVVEISGSD
ncbi:Class I heat shock protein [Melia azedarach]|uniref:Class I heat shock protein n=1 Tax=Melia azedarach TaxID=155640 RepID=A0ACC1XD62_MELAZ|nr:Class I heat shock protein [Melia azedarach]